MKTLFLFFVLSTLLLSCDGGTATPPVWGPPTTTVTQPGSNSAVPITITLPSGGNDAKILCYFPTITGTPRIVITDNATPETPLVTYIRGGSGGGSSPGVTPIPANTHKIFSVSADPTVAKTITITVTKDGATPFDNVDGGLSYPYFLTEAYSNTSDNNQAVVIVYDAGVTY